MEAVYESIPTFAFAFGGWEIALILALILILLGAKRLPKLSRGIDQGMREFRRATDDMAEDAGKSLGGIYGKPASEALTPENQTSELYDPAALRDKEGARKSTQRAFRLGRLWRRILRFISNLIVRKSSEVVLAKLRAAAAPRIPLRCLFPSGSQRSCLARDLPHRRVILWSETWVREATRDID